MGEEFKAIVINQTENNFTRDVKSLKKSFFKSGDIFVNVDYSGLNYKDALILNNGAKLVKEYPQIPGIDFSGKVVESENANFKIGENVILTGWRVGEIYPGGYAQFAKVKSEFLVKTPKKLTNKNAMMLGTAGLTALLCSFAIKAREELLLGEKIENVLVTGATGGVGSIAVMILSKFGYKVTAVTGKKDQNNFLKELGASKIINREEFEGEAKLLGKGLWDGVVDTVGGNILSNVISQTKHSGIVAACGNAGGIKLNTSVMPFIIRGIKLWGVDSIAISSKRREFLWNKITNLVDFEILEKYTKTVGLEELLTIFPNMLKGKIAGRILVDVNK